jgi:hypothetical protein
MARDTQIVCCQLIPASTVLCTPGLRHRYPTAFVNSELARPYNSPDKQGAIFRQKGFGQCPTTLRKIVRVFGTLSVVKTVFRELGVLWSLDICCVESLRMGQSSYIYICSCVDSLGTGQSSYIYICSCVESLGTGQSSYIYIYAAVLSPLGRDNPTTYIYAAVLSPLGRDNPATYRVFSGREQEGDYAVRIAMNDAQS